jgi:hypothetical protein
MPAAFFLCVWARALLHFLHYCNSGLSVVCFALSEDGVADAPTEQAAAAAAAPAAAAIGDSAAWAGVAGRACGGRRGGGQWDCGGGQWGRLTAAAICWRCGCYLHLALWILVSWAHPRAASGASCAEIRPRQEESQAAASSAQALASACHGILQTDRQISTQSDRPRRCTAAGALWVRELKTPRQARSCMSGTAQLPAIGMGGA